VLAFQLNAAADGAKNKCRWGGFANYQLLIANGCFSGSNLAAGPTGVGFAVGLAKSQEPMAEFLWPVAYGLYLFPGL